MKTIHQLIEASREREKDVTKGPWGVFGDGTHVGTIGDRNYIVSSIARFGLSPAKNNASFIAHARTTEPLFREVAAVALEALEVLSSKAVHISAADPILDYKAEISMRSAYANDALSTIKQMIPK